MIFWIDAQLSPALAPWLSERFEVQAFSLKHLGFRDALDRDIFLAAKEAGAVIMTKDSDFLLLLERAVRLLASGEALVEISESR